MIKQLSVVIPVYKEQEKVVQKTVSEVTSSLKKVKGLVFEILVVNDGTPDMTYSLLDKEKNVRVLQHSINRGYSSALKTGIKAAKHEWIAITDADGTYPNYEFHVLIKNIEDNDMIIGARPWKQISLIRRFPKYVLTSFASFLAGEKIIDLNSGMRIFRKDLCMDFWRLYPKGFSFTSTITMGFLTQQYKTRFYPITYKGRVGKSHIKPVQDTIRFFTLVARLTLYFNPIKFFFPLTAVFLLLAVMRGLRDYWLEGALGGLTLVLFFISFQIFFFGLLAEIINKK